MGQPELWFTWMKIAALIVGLIFGGFAVFSASWVWLSRQQLSVGSGWLATLGVAMIGMSIWPNIEIEGPSTKVKLSGTGSGAISTPSIPTPPSIPGGGHTEVWFTLNKREFSYTECLEKAKLALQTNGFINGGVNQTETSYGYKADYVAAIWCPKDGQVALVIVAGPDDKIASAEQLRLAQAFFPPQS